MEGMEVPLACALSVDWTVGLFRYQVKNSGIIPLRESLITKKDVEATAGGF